MNIFNDFHQRFLIALIKHDLDVPFPGYEGFMINIIPSGRLTGLADVDELQKIHCEKQDVALHNNPRERPV